MKMFHFKEEAMRGRLSYLMKQENKEEEEEEEGKDYKVRSSSEKVFKRKINLTTASTVSVNLIFLVALTALSANGEQAPQQQLLPRRYASFAAGEADQFLDQLASLENSLPPATAQSRARAMSTSQRVEMVVPPYENYQPDTRRNEPEVSYVIDNKRFIEAVPTRCMTSTYLEDPDSYEPFFALIKPNSEIKLNATTPTKFIQMAGFEPNKKTVILVHGFTQSYPDTVWLRRTRALFEVNARVGRQNLFIMDYGRAAHLSYAQVAAMASGMGSFLANFLMKLFELGADPMSVHVVAHSLGAHIAGFAGKRVRPRIGRITALDAAGPCFGKILSNSPMDRLSPEDAYEVDAYHYDDDFLGLPGQHGHFDVYVNGGASQPGCTDNMNTMVQALITMVFRRKRVLSESHTRSTEVATVRLAHNNCQQVAYECKDYNSFTLGECARCDQFNNQCFLMGFDYQYADIGEIPLRTNRNGKRLYISTGNVEPFCLQHYQILVRFEPSTELAQLAKRNKWRIQLEALDEQGKHLDVTGIVNQMAPNVFSYLLLSEQQPARIKSARIQVRQADGKLVVLKQAKLPQRNANNELKQMPIRAFSVEFNFMSHISPRVRQSLSSRLCPVAAPSSGASPSEPANNALEGSDAWNYFELCAGVDS